MNYESSSLSLDSPFNAAVMIGRLETIRILLEAGADANVKDAVGRTVLDTAIMLKKDEAVIALLRGAQN